MKIFFLLIFFVVVLAGVPYAARATEVGFVPSSGIWFSKQSVAPGESVKVYAVIINNAYPVVQATVAFYDNGDETGIIKIDKLEQEQARELWIQWAPHPGSHKVTARFINAAMVGIDGKETTLDASALNTIGESSFNAPAGSPAGWSTAVGVSAQGATVLQKSNPVNTTPVSVLAQNANALAGDGVMVQVKKEGDKLLLRVVAPDFVAGGQEASANAAATTKIANVASKNNDAVSARNVSASSTFLDRVKNTVETAVEKIKNVGDTARGIRERTVSTIHDARNAVEKGRVRAEGIGNAARETGRNKIALAWGGFLAFIALSGVLSYARWRKFR
ncbi:MAG: hypothetical protein HY981_02665 [Candidatus Magasanikbacteria bacterium]|nr:hypothetical protein [Candidatus Magasanikbacteria bacterium]